MKVWTAGKLANTTIASGDPDKLTTKQIHFSCSLWTLVVDPVHKTDLQESN